MKRFSIIVFILLCFQGYSQFEKRDSLGNFYVIDYKLVWQKWYPLEDKVALNKMLKRNNFTADLDILKFGTSVQTKPYRLVGNNLPEYAQHDYQAFMYIDFIGGRYRVSIKQIIFPDFIEKEYYNGRRINNLRGTLEQYLIRQDGLIKRNNATINVLNTFDSAFSEVFDYMGRDPYE